MTKFQIDEEVRVLRVRYANMRPVAINLDTRIIDILDFDPHTAYSVDGMEEMIHEEDIVSMDKIRSCILK